MRHFSLSLIVLLVCLRLATGWHFYNEGQKKFDGSFTSKYFLLAAKGPAAPIAQGIVNENSERDALLATPREYGSVTTEKPYTVWLQAVEQEWLNRAAEVDNESVTEFTQQKLVKLKEYLDSQIDTIVDIQHEAWRAEKMRTKNQSSDNSDPAPFAQKRLSSKEAEIKNWITPILATADSYEEELGEEILEVFESEGVGVAKYNQMQSIFLPTSTLSKIDTVVKWTVLLCGIGLFLGFCTRVAAIVAAGFLLSVMATQPLWVEGADTTYFFYQLVEVIALITLAYVGAGQWAGFDIIWNSETTTNTES